MKAIRSQLKTSNMFMIPQNFIGLHLDWHYSVLYAVKKEQQIETTNKSLNKIARKRFESCKPIFCTPKKFN